MSGATPAPSGAPSGSTSRNALVVVASTRAAAGTYADETGPLLVEWLEGRGWSATRTVVADGDEVGAAIRRGVAFGVDLVVTTGGTGVTPNDSTPEQTRPVIERELPGVAEAIRARGAAHVATAVLSRGLAGVAGRTVIVNLPGSRGGVRDGIAVLDEVLDHLVDQLGGGDHVR